MSWKCMLHSEAGSGKVLPGSLCSLCCVAVGGDEVRVFYGPHTFRFPSSEGFSDGATPSVALRNSKASLAHAHLSRSVKSGEDISGSAT